MCHLPMSSSTIGAGSCRSTTYFLAKSARRAEARAESWPSSPATYTLDKQNASAREHLARFPGRLRWGRSASPPTPSAVRARAVVDRHRLPPKKRARGEPARHADPEWLWTSRPWPSTGPTVLYQCAISSNHPGDGPGHTGAARTRLYGAEGYSVLSVGAILRIRLRGAVRPAPRGGVRPSREANEFAVEARRPAFRSPRRYTPGLPGHIAEGSFFLDARTESSARSSGGEGRAPSYLRWSRSSGPMGRWSAGTPGSAPSIELRDRARLRPAIAERGLARIETARRPVAALNVGL